MLLSDRQKRILFYVIGAITVGFILLTLFVLFYPLSGIDREFSEEVQEHHNSFIDAVMKMISWFGYMPNSPIVVISVALLFFIFKYRKEALFLLLTMLAGLVSSIVKIIVNRPRPTSSLVRILGKTQQQSFPSGHVIFYVVFFGFLILLMYHLVSLPKVLRIAVSILSMLLILAIPISRVYLGAHWFTDVLGGYLLGILCLTVLSYFYFKKQMRSMK